MNKILKFLGRFLIPRDYYCYRRYNNIWISCPFWSCDKTKPEQENGYCSFIGRGDWESDGLSLLWDKVKECGENMAINEWDWFTAEEIEERMNEQSINTKRL